MACGYPNAHSPIADGTIAAEIQSAAATAGLSMKTLRRAALAIWYRHRARRFRPRRALGAKSRKRAIETTQDSQRGDLRKRAVVIT
jgi:hypothetical protein